MRLEEYQERLGSLTEAHPVRLKLESYPDAMPGWVSELEKFADSVQCELGRFTCESDSLVMQYWVDRKSVKSGDPKIGHAMFRHEMSVADKEKLERALTRKSASFSKKIKRICAVCGSDIVQGSTASNAAFRCGIHLYIEDADVCDDLWDEIYGANRNATNKAINAVQNSLTKWYPSMCKWEHNTRRNWYRDYAYKSGNGAIPLKTIKTDKVDFIGVLALRSLARTMGDRLQSRKSVRWIDSIVERTSKANEYGVDDLPMLGSVMAVTIQEHGSPLFIVSCIDGFLNINGYELCAPEDDLRVALDSLSNGAWEATEFSNWLAQNMRTIGSCGAEKYCITQTS